MNMIRVDTRGLSCPQPVVLVMKAIEDGHASFAILLDSETSVDNVTRLLRSKGVGFERAETDDGIVLHARR